MVTSVADDPKGEKLIVLHTELGVEVEEWLRRRRDSTLPKLRLPRKENFFAVDSLPILGSGKLDLKNVKETAGRLTGVSPRSEEPPV